MKRPSRDLPAPPRCFAAEIPHFAALCGIKDPAKFFGVGRALLDDSEAMVPVTVLYDALERAAAHSGNPHFGLRFARHWTKVTTGGMGVMQFLLRSSPSLRTACERILHYQHFWNRAEWYELVQEGRAYKVRFRCWGPPREAHVHQAEKTAALIAFVPRGIDPAFRPLAVSFPHAPRGEDGKLERVFGVTPTFWAPWTEVALPLDIMDMAPPSANPAMFEFFDRYLAKEMAQLPREAHPFSGEAFKTVARLLSEKEFNLPMIARAMGCGPRTLARRLADEGTTLREIVDSVRKGRAEALLEAKMPPAEVAFLLGYSDLVAFQHAFRRWHGVSPKAWLEARPPESS